MKKSNLIKVISILVISLMVTLFSTNVMAAETNNGFTDLTQAVGNGTNNASGNSNTANLNALGTNNTNRNNTNSNSNRTNTNNSSIYDNTNTLPKTGVEDSVPVAVLLIVFAISAVYAYKKVKDYKNV